MSQSQSSPRQGQTTPAQGEKQERTPRQPHERDESADSQAAAEPSGQQIGKVAHDDLAKGRKDTSKAAEMDAAYKKTKGA